MSVGEGAWVLHSGADRFDRAIEWLLFGLLAFMPFAFGAVEAWSEEIVIALAAAISICFLVKVTAARNGFVTWTWAYIPIAAFLLLAFLQTVPLPVALVRFLSPQTVVQKLALLRDLHGTDVTAPGMTASFYLHGTVHDLRLALAIAAIFVVVFNVVRTPDQIARLLGAIVVIGVAIVLVAFAQVAFGNGKIYWFVPSPHGVIVSGPFVNHSHYSQFMNLSVGAAVGLIFAKLHARFGRCPVTAEAVTEYLGSRDGKLLLGLLLMVVLGAASVFLSLSRGGMISMMIAGAFTTLVISSRRSLKGSGWVMAVLALGAFLCVLYVGFDAVYDRLGTLREIDKAEAGRWQIVKDIAGAWARFPILGTGLGTHEMVYPMFDRSTVPAIASHAENEYAQTAEETGVIGLAALMLLGAFAWSSYIGVVRNPRTAIHSAAYGLGFGLLAILVHSLSDFGQHLPANACLSAIFCALLIRLRHIGADPGVLTGDIAFSGIRARKYGVIGLGLAGLLFAPALLSADAARCAEAHWAKALQAERDMKEKDWQGSDEEYTYLLSHAAAAQECQPANVVYRHWLNVYRWHAISRAADPNTGEVNLPVEALEIARRIANEQRCAIPFCVTWGPSWTVLGQIERFVSPGDEGGARHIVRGRQLAPCDPTVCFVMGMLCAEQGDLDAAFREWQRAVALDGQLFGDVCPLLVTQCHRVDLADALAGEDLDRLLRLESILKGSNENTELLETMAGRIVSLLERKCREPGAAAREFARLAERYGRLGRNEDAVRMYRSALGLDYAQVSWRYSLAELLGKQGLRSEAVHELEICLHLRPQFPAAQRLLERLLVQVNAGSRLN